MYINYQIVNSVKFIVILYFLKSRSIFLLTYFAHLVHYEYICVKNYYSLKMLDCVGNTSNRTAILSVFLHHDLDLLLNYGRARTLSWEMITSVFHWTQILCCLFVLTIIKIPWNHFVVYKILWADCDEILYRPNKMGVNNSSKGTSWSCQTFCW